MGRNCCKISNNVKHPFCLVHRFIYYICNVKYSKIPIAQTIVLLCEKFGFKNVVISPGSRNAPLVVGFASNNYFNCYSIIDERSAGFFALGIAQQKKHPVILLCTSGSALLNYSPSISEAYYSEVPLIVISADRPSYKINIGDGQTVDQTNVFGNNILRSINLNQDIVHSQKKILQSNLQNLIPENIKKSQIKSFQSKIDEKNLLDLNKIFNDCIEKSSPVHLNVPLEEPLYEFLDKPSISVKKSKPIIKDELKNESKYINLLNKYSKIMVLVGCQSPGELSDETVFKLNQNSNVVVLKETTSNIHDSNLFGNIDRLLAPLELLKGTREVFSTLQPELLITLGGMIVSKKIKSFLRDFPPIVHIHLGSSRANDTFFKHVKHLKINANSFFRKMEHKATSEKSFYSKWQKIDSCFSKYERIFIDKAPFSDLKVFSIIANQIPGEYLIQASNSSTIRYLQLFNLKNHNFTYCNRGVSGIDGSTSTAVGASITSNKPVVLITGDLSFFYDINGLWNNYLKNDLRIIIVNNGGGGIFRILPGFKENEVFSKFIETKQHKSAKWMAKHFGFSYQNKKTKLGLKLALINFFKKSSKPKILEISTSSKISSNVLKNYFQYLSNRHEK